MLAKDWTSASRAVVLAGYRTGCRAGSGGVTEGQAGARTGVEAAVTAARQCAGSARAEEGHEWPGGVEAQEAAGLMFGRSGVAVPAADSRPVAVVVHCWKLDRAPGSPAAGLASFGG